MPAGWLSRARCSTCSSARAIHIRAACLPAFPTCGATTRKPAAGSGKTTVGRCILRLIDPSAGEAFFDGVDLFRLREKALRAYRRRLQIVFQDPYSSLNPRMRVRDIIGEAIDTHGLAKGAARQ